MFIDSHAHLGSEEFREDIDALLTRSRDAGVGAIVNICTDPETLQTGLALADRYPWIYNTASTTPHDVEVEGELFFPQVVKAARAGKLVAIGETGLDYYRDHADRSVQKEYLTKYLHLALELGLPMVIHCRDAFADFFNILDKEYRQGDAWGPGVLHCFTGTVDEAAEVVKRGWFLSISGIVTFKKSEALREVASKVPLEQLLIETDSPWLAPQSHRGKRNEPSYLPETALVVAGAKGVTIEQVAAATAANAKRLFRF